MGETCYGMIIYFYDWRKITEAFQCVVEEDSGANKTSRRKHGATSVRVRYPFCVYLSELKGCYEFGGGIYAPYISVSICLFLPLHIFNN